MSKRQKKVDNLLQARALATYLLQERVAFEVTTTDKGWKVSFQCSPQKYRKVDTITRSSYDLASLLAAYNIDASKTID